MFTKTYIFEPKDLLGLLIHYTDGEIPLDAEIKEIGFNPYLKHMIGLEITSNDWKVFDPLHIRYEGNKIMSWSKNMGVDHPVWGKRNDTPKIQG